MIQQNGYAVRFVAIKAVIELEVIGSLRKYHLFVKICDEQALDIYDRRGKYAILSM